MLANTNPHLPGGSVQLHNELRGHATLINLLANGRLAGTNNATTAAPTTGPHARGDFIRNSEPSEAGVAGSMYVTIGWVCSVGGTPGTWLPCRFLTGN